MESEVNDLIKEIESAKLETAEALEAFRLRFLSRNGLVQAFMGRLKEVAPEARRATGQLLNGLKVQAESAFAAGKETIEACADVGLADFPSDATLPPPPFSVGSAHPLSIVRNRILEIFRRLGFGLAEGPEIEDDWHNFTALNFPPDHPAREMQDTFFVARNPDIVLRTHTSPVQIRVLKHKQPPVRVIMPGRVYRNEAITARAHCLFHQIEGLYVDKNVSFRDLKDTLYFFVREMFGQETKIRFRASYFPFTEPSAEMDISCLICKGKGCNVCKQTGWVEILGSGMVHPNVLTASGVDPEQYSGFAFGMGVERTAMLLYQIKDLRLFTENDLRFLRQFASE